jgi:hypothetical protein
MHPDIAEKRTTGSLFYKPLFPEKRDQGDPYILALPPEAGARYRYYIFTSYMQPYTGRAFPCYASDDLANWTLLGECLTVDGDKCPWAPCVTYLPHLPRPYVMLYSEAVGLGKLSHVGHHIRRADALRPEGPYEFSGQVLTEGIDFAIDADIYRAPTSRGGGLMMAYAADFVEDLPLGTGILETAISPDLDRTLGEPRVLARARGEWELYDPARQMPWKEIPGVDWERGDRVRWYTVEAPVGGLLTPSGREAWLYSGGCFFNFYAVGALRTDGEGHIEDLSGDGSHLVLSPHPEAGFYAPGHCSYLNEPDLGECLVAHARFGDPKSPRQMCLAPLRWTDDRPFCPPPSELA